VHKWRQRNLAASLYIHYINNQGDKHGDSFGQSTAHTITPEERKVISLLRSVPF